MIYFVTGGEKMRDLSSTEFEILQALWKANKEMNFQEIYEYLVSVEKKTWAPGTVNSFLARMEKKGVFKTRKEGKAKYYKPISEKAYERKKINNSLYSNYGYDFNQLLLNFVGEVEEDEEMLRKAHQLLDDLKKDG